MIAEELSEKINKEGFEKVEALGPYVNFFMDKGSL
jgi:arginyl-tRNA synthetase